MYTRVVKVRPLSFDGEDTWRHGNSLLNYINMLSIFHITQVVRVRLFSCDGEDTWQHVNSLLNYIKMVSFFSHHSR
jgi:hypothetical protein